MNYSSIYYGGIISHFNFLLEIARYPDVYGLATSWLSERGDEMFIVKRIFYKVQQSVDKNE